ncbi:MAG: transcriptional regulator [Gammaproteobacteria bacterium]|nr:transcriptional regulator [Gammaproteobacteria bacterium]
MVAGATLDVRKVKRAASEAAGVLRLLANEDRLAILCQLIQGEACVSELETLLEIKQPTLSQQLGVLRNDEIVATRREGKNIYYQIADRRVLALLQLMYELFCVNGRKAS